MHAFSPGTMILGWYNLEYFGILCLGNYMFFSTFADLLLRSVPFIALIVTSLTSIL